MTKTKAQAKSIQWLPDLDAALDMARRENKHVLLDFFNPS
jgi:hypothetical protein